jgi:serine/threonine protein kinase
VLHEVLEALSYAHARTGTNGEPLGIVHRDVSPANVLVSYLGEVKLSDFGIVKAAGRVSKTDERVIKGNVNFMSPEQARGEPVDLRSDLFSAGVVMFFCLTGRTLYSGDSTINQLMRAAVGPVTEQFEQLRDSPARGQRHPQPRPHPGSRPPLRHRHRVRPRPPPPRQQRQERPRPADAVALHRRDEDRLLSGEEGAGRPAPPPPSPLPGSRGDRARGHPPASGVILRRASPATNA